MASRLREGTTVAEREALEWKVCMRGRGRLAMLGWAEGRALVVRPREDCEIVLLVFLCARVECDSEIVLISVVWAR